MPDTKSVPKPPSPPKPDPDVRAGPLHDVGDPKDSPILADDVSAIADPDDPTKIMDPGEDPDFGGRRGGTNK